MSARYLRFFAPVTPGPNMLRLLSGDAADVDAVVAVRGGVIIGHAMGADRVEPGGVRVTDVGVVVADAWQGRGRPERCEKPVDPGPGGKPGEEAGERGQVCGVRRPDRDGRAGGSLVYLSSVHRLSMAASC